MAFLAPALPFLTVASAAVGAVGAISAGEAQAQAAHYQAQVAANNAIIAKQNAQHAAQSGAVQTELAEQKAAQQFANVRAGLAANNVDVNTGSAVDVQESQRKIGNFEAATTANRAAEAVYGYQTQGTNFTAQSKMYEAEAPYDAAGSYLKGASTLLSAAPSVPAAYAWMTGGGGGGAASTGVDKETGDLGFG